MKKPYLISLASHTAGVDRYLDSIVNLRDSVELVYVDFHPHVPYKIKGLSDIQVIKVGDQYPGHHRRWSFLPDHLDKDRWWIFTDTQDVVFQNQIPDLDTFDEDILVQYEGMTHQENEVWRNCIENRWLKQMGNLLPLPVYCCGVFAAKGYLMHEYKSYITGYSPDIWDQLPFNQWLIGKKFKDCRELSVALYKNYYSGEILCSGENWFWADTGIYPSIIHGNGSSKELLW